METVTAKLTSGTKVEITDGRHTWNADEPIDANGTDIGPNPYELMLGALAACTCITLKLYCNHKGIALKSVSSSHKFERVELDNEESAGKKVERITSTVKIEGDLDDAQRKRLTQVAGRCPVHKSIANGVAIVDSVEFA